MLVCFLKDGEEEHTGCEIVGYCDRLWVNNDGGVDCLRTFIINNTDQEHNLISVRMIIPWKALLEIKDLSPKFLDPEYLFTKYSSGGYELVASDPISKSGTIKIDSFDNVKIYSDSVITWRSLDSDGVILLEVKNKHHPILPREFRLISLRFSVSSLLDQVFGGDSDIYSLSLSYFNKTPFEEAINKLMGGRNLEIPVKKMYNAEIRQGGFDIFLYLPPNLQGQDFNSHKITESTALPDGQEGPKRQKFLWRGRLQFPDPTPETLGADKTSFDVHGYIRDPHKLRNLEGNLKRIEVFLKKSHNWVKIGITLSLIAIGKAFWPEIYSFLISCFKVISSG